MPERPKKKVSVKKQKRDSMMERQQAQRRGIRGGE